MVLELKLPYSLYEELEVEAAREGMPKDEHLALLVCLASTLVRDDVSTPFKAAVRAILTQYSLDTERLGSAFEAIMHLCSADLHDFGKTVNAWQSSMPELIPSGADPKTILADWRNALVHSSGTTTNPQDSSPNVIITLHPAMKAASQRGGRVALRDTVVESPIMVDENGVAWIEGTTTKVIEVVLNKEWTGRTAEELQQDMPDLNLAQIYAALAYHYAHIDGLEEELERHRQFSELAPVLDEAGIFHEDRWERVLASIVTGSVKAPALPPESLTREALYCDHD